MRYETHVVGETKAIDADDGKEYTIRWVRTVCVPDPLPLWKRTAEKIKRAIKIFLRAICGVHSPSPGRQVRTSYIWNPIGYEQKGVKNDES